MEYDWIIISQVSSSDSGFAETNNAQSENANNRRR
jgi:hypothetical protein